MVGVFAITTYKNWRYNFRQVLKISFTTNLYFAEHFGEGEFLCFHPFGDFGRWEEKLTFHTIVPGQATVWGPGPKGRYGGWLAPTKSQRLWNLGGKKKIPWRQDDANRILQWKVYIASLGQGATFFALESYQQKTQTTFWDTFWCSTWCTFFC